MVLTPHASGCCFFPFMGALLANLKSSISTILFVGKKRVDLERTTPVDCAFVDAVYN